MSKLLLGKLSGHSSEKLPYFILYVRDGGIGSGFQVHNLEGLQIEGVLTKHFKISLQKKKGKEGTKTSSAQAQRKADLD